MKKAIITIGIIFALFVAFMFGRDVGVRESTSFYRQCLEGGASGFYILDNEINCIYE